MDKPLKRMSIWKHLTGSTGSLFAGLCCLGFTPALVLLTAIGAGFLINDLILIPLFIIFLGISIRGLKSGSGYHGNIKPFRFGTISAVIAFITLWFAPIVAYIGLFGLVTASIWDIYMVKTCVKG